MNKTKRTLAPLLLVLNLSLNAQNLPSEVEYNIESTTESIVLDGKLDETVWQTLPKAGGFYQTFPTDDQPAVDSTQFMITYTDKAVLFGIICWDGLPGPAISTTRRRDFEWGNNDNVGIYIDPYNDNTNGFTFQVTPNNVQREGLVLIGGSVRDDWDNKWYSAVHKGDGFWSVEVSIPFKSIRYNNASQWNIQVLRNNLKRNERTSWINVKQGYRMSNLTFTGRINWDVPAKSNGPNLTVIPYVAGSASRNHEEQEPTQSELNAGFDAKVAVSSSLNLDLTFDPDFSQVEVDQQVTNLQRFEIFFPERRQFFLENQDLFADGGFPRSRPFFSRRIGIQGSGETQRNVPILAGARLSGKIGSKWRVGALNMITSEDATSKEISPAQNYSVGVLERSIFNRSRISAIFVGRNNLGTAALETFRVDSDRVLDRFG
ncbi:MAG: carbohydrate binding family 9 domain-containing protein, partial [Ekhidna sp.]|nr:carbohydrate binding family 9 domain-containing protein [Ekhidna sp.]